MMRKFLIVGSVAVLGTLGLGACNHSNQANTTTETQATRPSNTAVDDAVKECRAKHPNAAAPAPAQTAAPAAGRTAAPAAGQTAAPVSAQTAAQASSADTSDEDPCARATIAASTWQPYLQQVVIANMGNITNNPYFYFVPSSKYPENQGYISRTRDQLDSVVQATVLPGNMVAAGGPDSATTAQLLEAAFKQASPGSFKGVVVLFIGDKADEAAVKSAVDPSGATFKFVQM
jgi:hypothetical protein